MSRGHGFYPDDGRRVAGLHCRDLPRSCPGHAAVRAESCWSARSRAAARTNELDAAKRWHIIGSEEGFLVVFFERVVLGVPGVWWAEWSHKHPFGVVPAGGRHDHVSGDRAAQSCDRAWACRPAHADVSSAPGVWRPLPGLMVWLPGRPVMVVRPRRRRAGGRRGSAACGRSRWWRSSSRGAWRSRRRWH